MFIEVKNPPEAFVQSYRLVSQLGTKNEDTVRLNGVLISVERPLDFHQPLWPSWRNWSQRYVDTEWKWYEAATRDPQMVEEMASIWTKMKDERGEVNSNYGWQVKRNAQWSNCLKELTHAVVTGQKTRKSVLTIYDGKERNRYDYDTPCTLSFTFVLKHLSDRIVLDMHTHMRSNDVWYGLCNDLPAFALFQEKMASQLQSAIETMRDLPPVVPGRLLHFVDDLHIYDKFLNRETCNSITY